jgi:hypothetical protein
LKEPLSIGQLKMNNGLRPLSLKAALATDQVARLSHADRKNVSLRENSASQQSCDLFSVDAIIPGLSLVNHFHDQCMGEDESDVSFGAEICWPVPAAGGFAGDNEAVATGCECEVELINAAGEFTVQEFASCVVEGAEVKCSGREGNAMRRMHVYS